MTALAILFGMFVGCTLTLVGVVGIWAMADTIFVLD